MDREEKERSVERYRKAAKKHKSFAEQKRLKEEARRRRAVRREPARERWSAEDEDAETRERMGSGRASSPRHAGVPEVPPVRAGGLPDALVIRLARSRVRLLHAAGEILEAALPPALGLAVGDRVALERVPGGLARVRARLPRASWLARPDPAHPERRLVLAANVELVVCVVAAREPRWKPGFVDRVRLAADEGRARLAVVVNKVDLLAEAARAELAEELASALAPGERPLCLSATTGESVAELVALTRDRTCVLVGPSGVGKSSLVHALDPAVERATGPVRSSEGKGRHTTTASELLVLANGARLIDTPGVRQLGLTDLDRRALAATFPDFAVHRVRCRFTDCAHVTEPACAVLAALAAGELDARRYAIYRRIRESLER